VTPSLSAAAEEEGRGARRGAQGELSETDSLNIGAMSQIGPLQPRIHGSGRTDVSRAQRLLLEDTPGVRIASLDSADARVTNSQDLWGLNDVEPQVPDGYGSGTLPGWPRLTPVSVTTGAQAAIMAVKGGTDVSSGRRSNRKRRSRKTSAIPSVH
jgi:hypothetical protein